MDKLFPVYEIGSLPKLNARAKAEKNQEITEQDISYVKALSKRFNIINDNYDNIIEILEKRKNNYEEKLDKLTEEEKATLIDFNALLYIKIQESLGLDFIYDGEARRSEMYRHVSSYIDGFQDSNEMIRSRGPDSWRMSICTKEPRLKENSLDRLINKEFDFVFKNTTRKIKIPIDDPYMIAVMSDNLYFKQKLKNLNKNLNPEKLNYEAKREFTLALAENVIKPQIDSVIARGAKWIQLDMPAATLDIEHIPIIVEGVNAIVNKIETNKIKDVKFSLHICYPRRVSLTEKKGYELLFPHLLFLDKKINHLSLELANNNNYEQDLSVFKKYNNERKFEIAIGVIDITLEQQQKGFLESPEIVRERITKAAEILEPNLIYVAPDCGLRQLNLDRCIRIYENIVEGVELARRG